MGKQKDKKPDIDSGQRIEGEARKTRILTSLALIVIVGFGVYINSLNGEFIWDDYHLIQHNKFIKNFSHIPEIFTKDIEAGFGIRSYAYRPLQIFTYMLDYSLWRLNRIGYHLTNILLHVAVGLCIFWFIYNLFDDSLLALLAGIFFVVHPIHTEAVAYISGRADSLALLFMLLCFSFYIKYLTLDDNRHYLFMLVSYIAALLSRENSLILPILLLLYHYTFRKRLRLKAFLPILSIGLVYILLRATILGDLLKNYTYCSTTVFQRLPGFFTAITDYVRLVLLPFSLHMEYGDRVFSITDPKAITGIFIVGFLLFYAFRKRDTNRLVFFSVLWFFIALLPQSNIYPINAFMAEHWLYVPSIGFFLILARSLSHLYQTKGGKGVAVVLMATLLASYSYLTIRQNSYWMKPLSFYERTLRYAPDNIRIYNNLGQIYYDIGKKQQAIDLYKKAIEIDPDVSESYNNLGIAYFSLGEKQDAIDLFKKAIAIDPDFSDAYSNLALAYYNLGKKEDAIPLYKKAIEINPNFVRTYSNLADVYRDLGQNQDAIALYKKAIEINPHYAGAYNNLGLTYFSLGKRQEAIDLFKKAIEVDPKSVKSYGNLGNAYAAIGKEVEAIDAYRKAIAIDPDYAVAYFNLSVTYFRQGEHDLAIRYYDKAVGLGHKDRSGLSELLKPYRK